MRRALASWASSTLRGAHAESVVALSVVRCFATESEPSATGKQHRLIIRSNGLGSEAIGGIMQLHAVQGPTARK